jgi:excisionase family DNA binding protein
MSDTGRWLLAQLDADDLAELRRLIAPEASNHREPSATRSLVSCAQAAEQASVHVETIRRKIRSGELPASRIGRSLRIDATDLDTWLSADGHAPLPSTSDRSRAATRRGPRRPLADAMSRLGSVASNC